jgi:uncharacterized membrane protein SpoIIM required for sporulation
MNDVDLAFDRIRQEVRRVILLMTLASVALVFLASILSGYITSMIACHG